MPMPNFDAAGEASVATPSISTTIEELGQKIRAIWIEEKQRYAQMHGGRGHYYRPGPAMDGGVTTLRRYKPAWPRIAKFVFEHKLDPVRYIRAQFHQCKGRPPEHPDQLTGEKGMNRYLAYMEERPDISELTLARDTQLRAARDAVELNKRFYGSTNIDIYRDVILDTNVDITALFRYVLALQSGQEDLAKLWHEEALRQYLYEQDGYDQVWGTTIPAALKKEANDIRSLAAMYRVPK